MLDSHESHIRNMTGCRIDAPEIPDGLVGVWEVIGEEASTVALGEDTGVAPFRLRPGKGPHVEDVNDEDVARLRTIDRNRPTEDVSTREIGIANVVRTIIVSDLSIGP